MRTSLLRAYVSPQPPPLPSNNSNKMNVLLTTFWLSWNVIVELGFDGWVEQFALKMSPGSYLVNSVHNVGGECGSSGMIMRESKHKRKWIISFFPQTCSKNNNKYSVSHHSDVLNVKRYFVLRILRDK